MNEEYNGLRINKLPNNCMQGIASAALQQPLMHTLGTVKNRMQNWLASKIIARKVIQWIISLVVALCVALGFILIVLQLVHWYYISSHPIALEEKDLGYGLVMVLSLCLAAIGAIPIAGFSLWRFRKFISKRI